MLGTDSRIISRFDAFACFEFGEVDQSRKLVIKTSPFPFNVAIGSQEVVDYLQIHLDGSVNSEVAFSSLNKNVIKYHWETYYYLLLFQFLLYIGIPYTGFVLLQVFGTDYDNSFVKLSFFCCIYSIILQVIGIFTLRRVNEPLSLIRILFLIG